MNLKIIAGVLLIPSIILLGVFKPDLPNFWSAIGIMISTPFLLIYKAIVSIPVIYYFLSAIIVLLVMIFIRLNANKKRED